MAAESESRPLAELLGGLASDISTLFRKEVQLAKTEVSENVSQAMGAMASIAIGGVLALGALGVFLSAIVSIVAAFLVNTGMDPALANAVSAFVVAAIVGIAAWVSISKGLNAFKTNNLNMNRTTASLGRDADIVKERL
jgi:ABC-type Na+ efflux pump permease subunit